MRAAIARVVEKQEAFTFASREDAFAAAVPTELSRRPPKADDSANASASPPTASENESSVRRNFRRALLVGCAYFAPRRPELTRLRGALNDVEAVREVLASLYGLDADDPDRTRILTDRPPPRRKKAGRFSAVSPENANRRARATPGRRDCGAAAVDDVPNVPNVPAEGDTPQGGVEGNDDMSQNVPDSGTTAYPAGRAGRANVLAGLAWLTDGAKAGDVLFFHFSGHATQVPSSVAETGELDGADEALCTVDTDWETCVGVTEHELVRELFAKVPNGATLVASVDAKLCGALRGSATYAADDAFVEASARRLAAFPRLSEKRAQTHDEIFGRFVPPPKPSPQKSRGARRRRARRSRRRGGRARRRSERGGTRARRRTSWWRSGGGADAAKGETCRETPCADGAVRGAFTEALCAALRAREGSPLAEAEDTPRLSAIRDCTRRRATRRRWRRRRRRRRGTAGEKAFVVEKCDARAQTPIAVVAYEGTELDGGGGGEGREGGMRMSPYTSREREYLTIIVAPRERRVLAHHARPTCRFSPKHAETPRAPQARMTDAVMIARF